MTETSGMQKKETIREYVEAHTDELTQIACELIRAKTENPPGNEKLAADVVEQYLKRYDIKYKTYEKAPGRTNVVASVGNGGQKFLVACHLDVVPAGDGWQMNPFEPEITNGRLYGRGATDNKGQMASMLLLIKFLKENESALGGYNGTFILVAAADEERGSAFGLEYLLSECNVHADYAIIPDVSHNMRLIDISEKGNLFLEIVSYGKQAHGSTPEKGINAIWNMIELLNQLKEMKFNRTSHPLHTPPTMNLGGIQGGAAPNIVPGKCKASLDIRYLPGETKQDVINKINHAFEAVKKKNNTANFELATIQDLPPTEIPANNPLVKLITNHAEAVMGVKPEAKGLSGTTVVKQLLQKDITAVGFGPGDEGQAHVANESISIQELKDFAVIMGLITFDLLK
jgi:acetylornithine deacetylase/succinyl-diaminopimelate desuccinylase family protein